MLYDRPVADLMADAATAMPSQFGPPDVIDWFSRHYPDVNVRTVRAHVIGLTVNAPSRKHYAWLARRPPLFYKGGSGFLQLFDPDVHLQEELERELDEDDQRSADLGSAAIDGSDLSITSAKTQEFYLEAYLEEFLITNWLRIDWGRPLRLWTGPGGESGHQLSTPIGRLDLLCEDQGNGSLVVVELKRGLPSDRVVGQTTRYMGWVAEHLANGRDVDGIIVAHEVNDQLRYAVRPIPRLSLLVYEISFALRPPTP